MSRRAFVSALCALGLLVPAPAALAQSSEDTSGADQYTEQGIPGADPTPAPEPAPTPAPAPAPAPSGPATVAQTDETVTETAPAETLPYTGLETGLIALIALSLLGAGVFVRRLPAWQDPTR